jgi:hypothetical protein
MSGLADQLYQPVEAPAPDAAATPEVMSEAEAQRLGLSKLHSTLGKRTQELEQARARIAELESAEAPPEEPPAAPAAEEPAEEQRSEPEEGELEEGVAYVVRNGRLVAADPPTPRSSSGFGRREFKHVEPPFDPEQALRDVWR